MKLIGILALAITMVVQDAGEYSDAKDLDRHDPASQAVSVLFFILTVAGTITFAVFLLIEAFRVEEEVCTGSALLAHNQDKFARI